MGHQAYAHKLLTGRRDSFHTLRQEGGISGFPKREESEYDSFDVGHSSTSISAALGMAKARDLRGGKNKVIAVIGDGSMTAGLAFEGLNHAGHLDTDLIVILNDNEMSISQNVGGLSSYLNRIMTGYFYNKFRKETESFLKHIPKIGGSMADLARRAEESFKNLIVPGMLFEELGFKYFGPIDGHDLDFLMDTLNNIKILNGPILLHLVTRRGRVINLRRKSLTSFTGSAPSILLQERRPSLARNVPIQTYSVTDYQNWPGRITTFWQ